MPLANLLKARKVRLELWVALAAGLILLATVAVVFHALNSLAAEVDRNDRQHFKTLTHAAVDSFVRRVRDSHIDYSKWDDAVQHIYGTPDLPYIQSNYGDSTATGTIFDTAFIVDENNITIAGFANGEAVAIPPAAFFDGDLEPFLRRQRAAESDDSIRTGIARTQNGIAVVAVGPIVPFSPGIILPKNERRTLIIAKHLDEAAIKRMSEDFLIRELRLADGNAQISSDRMLPLRSPTGVLVGTLTWKLPDTGSQAFAEIAPAAYGMLALLTAMVGTVVFITWMTVRATRESQGDAEHAALHDPLTHLPNRTALLAMAKNVAGGLSSGDDIAVAFFDLDGFKEVNDTHGHAAGDRALRGCAAGFSHIAEGRGLLARMGGDEFAFLALGGNARAVAKAVAESFITFLDAPIRTPEGELMLGTSVGIASGNSDDITILELLRRSDIAMYEAKRLGGNRIAFYDADIDAKLQERATLVSNLREALPNGEIGVRYQLIVDATTHLPCAVEVLARWTTRDGREVPPETFIPLAEECGLISDIGFFVMRLACHDAANWGLLLCVNVSPVQFHHPRFERNVVDILNEANFPANLLELEFTEHHLLSEPADALRTMIALRGRGIAIALDDFGTGYSSIGYLRSFPFDRLKLDRSICADVTRDTNVQSLIQGTIAIARSMNLKVTAEGVEDEFQARFLRLAGCDLLQGYYFSRPVPAAMIAERITALAQKSISVAG
ncbi:bifunctional diguanylate cyclase/phosphodiesterase [soil metagenome]